MAREWSEQQKAVFDWVEHGSGSAVVEAVAGAGKTTTLVEAVRRMRGSVFLGAYNSKMGAELKKRVADVPNAMAGTFHSAGFGALRRAAGGRRLEVDDKKVRKIVDAQIVDEERREWKPAVCHLVSLAQQAGFYCPQPGLVYQPTRHDWMEQIQRHDVMDRVPEGTDPNRLMDEARAALHASNDDGDVVSFDDMCYLPLLRDLRMFQNDWVLVDEAQDTNAVRRALAAKMLRRGGRLVAVGDPHQAIFGFTGADGESLELIKRQFSARTLELSVTYRCPKLVVAAAREYVGHIAAAATAPDGVIGAVEYEELGALAAPGDAVLCRYNAPLVALCFKLIRAGKPAKIEGRAIGEGLAALLGHWKVKTRDVFEGRLERHFAKERAKARDKDDEAKLDRLEDTEETLRVLVLRAREQGATTVAALQETVRAMFDDVGADARLVVLSSVHRSKGLEWDRVFILGRRELMPSRRAVQPWQRHQENNLLYVAITRAMHTLIDVSLPEKKDAA